MEQTGEGQAFKSLIRYEKYPVYRNISFKTFLKKHQMMTSYSWCVYEIILYARENWSTLLSVRMKIDRYETREKIYPLPSESIVQQETREDSVDAVAHNGRVKNVKKYPFIW